MDDASTTELFFAISERIDTVDDIDDLQDYKERALSMIRTLNGKLKQLENKVSPNQISLI